MYLWAAISIGLLGSAHCAGMCGPVLLAVNKGNQPLYTVLHHSGRIATYMLFGAAAGAIGKSFDILGVQQQFSLVMGALMISAVLLIPFSRKLKAIEGLISRVSLRFSSWIHRQGFPVRTVRFLAGMGNGLLPCGLVYLGVVGAANTFTPWDGALFMLLFGAGTLPALIGLSMIGARLGMRFRNRLRRLIPIGVFVMGCLLMVRGMDLGIPYLSPGQHPGNGQITTCE